MDRDFRALWIGATASELGLRISTFAMPLVAYAMTGSAAWAAASEAVFLLGWAATTLPAGVIADRVHRLRLMRASFATGAALYASLALAGVLGALTVPHLLLTAAAVGVATGFFSPAEHSAIRTIVSRDRLPEALSKQQARLHVAALLGGPAGGALFGLARWAPFVANTALSLVGWAMLGRIRADLSVVPDGTPRKRPLADLATGVRFVWARPFLRALLCWSPLANLVINALFFLALLRLIEAGFPAWQIGLVEAAVGACGILGAIAAPRIIDRYPTGLLTVVVAWSFLPLAIPMALWNHPLAMAIGASIGMFFNPVGNAGVGAYRMAVTPPAMVGRVQSTMQFASMMTMPLAPVLAGALLAVLGGRDAVLVVAALIGLVALIPTLSVAVRTVPRPRDWPRLTSTAGTA